MGEIVLSRGEIAIVDDADFERLNQWKWHFNGRYVKRREYLGGGRKNQRGRAILMHRLVNNTPPNSITDHINGNPLDNRRSNLRTCTPSQNQANAKISKSSSTGFKGVSHHKLTGKYQASITTNRKRQYLGLFDTPEDASEAYATEAQTRFGEFAHA